MKSNQGAVLCVILFLASIKIDEIVQFGVLNEIKINESTKYLVNVSTVEEKKNLKISMDFDWNRTANSTILTVLMNSFQTDRMDKMKKEIIKSMNLYKVKSWRVNSSLT